MKEQSQITVFDPIEYLLWTDMVYRYQQTDSFAGEFPILQLKHYGDSVVENLTDVLFATLLLDKKPNHAQLREKYEKYMASMSRINTSRKEEFNKAFVNLSDRMLAFLKKECRDTSINSTAK